LGDLEHEAVSTGAIYFCELDRRAGSWVEGKRLAPNAVPAVIYSETMRDADLLISRAASGEMGFSSAEMVGVRGALIREMARIVGWWNVCVSEDATYALIQGDLATYRLHLGSGSVFLEPEGRHLSLGALLESQEGFLPSEDADSRTVQILRTVALLSRDGAIASSPFRAQIGLSAQTAPLSSRRSGGES
jgi:hypothetical protein